MSKYDPLWDFVKTKGDESFTLAFDDIQKITGQPIGHSFLNYKKDLLSYGYRVEKISLKEQVVHFIKTV